MPKIKFWSKPPVIEASGISASSYTGADTLVGRCLPPNESVNSLMNGFCRECRAQWEATGRNWIPGQAGETLIWAAAAHQ